jgi:NAD(P)H-hydrate epimerase
MVNIGALMPLRNGRGAKWDFGRLLAICGSKQMPGAALMACGSALRSGVGLVELASVESVTDALSYRHPECILHPLPGEGGAVSPADLPLILPHLPRASAVLCGCGLGAGESQAAFLRTLLPQLITPTVLDADGLNLLARHPDLLQQTKASLVLTPHAVEFHRLSGLSVDAILADPLETASAFAVRHNVVVVLKGSITTVANPNGGVWQLDAPNSGMAKGGSGDVLAGLIAGFLAQGCSPYHTAILGVYLHALAGDLACKHLSARAMLPTDVIDHLGPAFLRLTEALR